MICYFYCFTLFSAPLQACIRRELCRHSWRKIHSNASCIRCTCTVSLTTPPPGTSLVPRDGLGQGQDRIPLMDDLWSPQIFKVWITLCNNMPVFSLIMCRIFLSNKYTWLYSYIVSYIHIKYLTSNQLHAKTQLDPLDGILWCWRQTVDRTHACCSTSFCLCWEDNFISEG